MYFYVTDKLKYIRFDNTFKINMLINSNFIQKHQDLNNIFSNISNLKIITNDKTLIVSAKIKKFRYYHILKVNKIIIRMIV